MRLVAPTGGHLWSLVTDDRTDRAIWLLAAKDRYGDLVTGAMLAFAAPRGARYRVVWVDDMTGQRVSPEPEKLTATDEDMVILRVPPFSRHIAGRVMHE